MNLATNPLNKRKVGGAFSTECTKTIKCDCVNGMIHSLIEHVIDGGTSTVNQTQDTKLSHRTTWAFTLAEICTDKATANHSF